MVLSSIRCRFGGRIQLVRFRTVPSCSGGLRGATIQRQRYLVQSKLPRRPFLRTARYFLYNACESSVAWPKQLNWYEIHYCHHQAPSDPWASAPVRRFSACRHPSTSGSLAAPIQLRHLATSRCESFRDRPCHGVRVAIAFRRAEIMHLLLSFVVYVFSNQREERICGSWRELDTTRESSSASAAAFSPPSQTVSSLKEGSSGHPVVAGDVNGSSTSSRIAANIFLKYEIWLLSLEQSFRMCSKILV